ncbi:MAG: glutamate synthase subunit alpha [Acidimicrobiia bacterium]|nr:glutamate synthase subunit alpha [Acidimicrobiia bacterium]
MPARSHDACGVGFVADVNGTASRSVLDAALAGLAGVRHRGAVAADALTSDGTGVLTPIPAGVYGDGAGVATLFTTPGGDPTAAFEDAARAEGLSVTWRQPPTDPSVLGELARWSMPEIRQALLADDGQRSEPEREVAAYRLRRRMAKAAPATYVVSCSFRTITHKGLVAADRLAEFWGDLADPAYSVHLAVFHQRFSTNTLPTWERAQPFRLLCHNGEINTIWGNQARMAGRGTFGTDEAGLGDEDLFHPLLDPDESDSGMLDEAAELLVRAGRSPAHALAMLIPEAWEAARDMSPAVRGFYEYHSALSEPWDGPAGVVFTDGIGVGATLDRNGLRPLRWSVAADGMVMCASEVGAVDLSGRGTVRRGRLGPGQMLWVSPDEGLLTDAELKGRLAAQQPYARWAAEGFYRLDGTEPLSETPDDLLRRQAAHGYTKEELAMILKPMAEDAKEPTFSMGDDSPLPPMAGRARPVHHYLRQRFAQVTNPPIDPLRERRVMSTRMLLGPRHRLLSEQAEAARLLELDSFLVYPPTVAELDDPTRNPFPVTHLDATFAVADGPSGLEARVRALADDAVAAVADGASIVVLDDGAVAAQRAPVPSLLATGAVHRALTDAGLRARASMVVVADDARDVHHITALVAYGADAVCPRLALQTVATQADEADNSELVGPEAQDRFRAAVESGTLKILSKMGIATVQSYRGSELFEVLGLADDVAGTCFAASPSSLGGVAWDDLGTDVLDRHATAWPAEGSEDHEPTLDSPGFYRVRKGGEPHGKSKEVVSALNELTAVAEPAGAAGNGTAGNGTGDNGEQVAEPGTATPAAAHLLQRAIRGESYELYEEYARLVDDRPPIELHDLLELVEADEPTPLDEVEPVSEIVRRFSTGAMSHGALSKEAHETLAQAMNLIGATSNCGEGGEDPARFRTRGLGRDDRNSRMKQVASGRFGVTPEYLAHADEIQIKIAQGSKPGEGGQLPGHKVSKEIARLRHTQPGVGLISPPPHHDIYSIEDLAQLIYDLKQVNAAKVSVKLVAADGVGTIAAGVVKALADTVHISGANGGTGASPLSSIKHAGMPWELGLADTQQALVDNGLRSRARVCVDGGFLTGRQVITAALLGADDYSFGTAAMIAEGCVMLRACHRDTCKPGVATQRPHLRANFAGTPEGVAAYFLFMAEEVRRYLSRLGARSLDEVIGRVELLRQRTTGDARVDSFDLASLLVPPADPEAPRRFVERVPLQDPRGDLGDQLLADAFRPVWEGDEIDLSYPIANTDRTVGAALSGAIALEYGELPPRGTARVRLDGAAGQSFGAFLTHGVQLDLVGEANDYVGKGMGGGRIVVRPGADDASHTDADPFAAPPALVGNTCLYGATGGDLFVAGAAGERFAVRNSGATAVVEGTGDHCAEYMTGGTVVVLGPIGVNLGAGMTGGRVFLWDDALQRVLSRVNSDLVEVLRPELDELWDLHTLVERHAEMTGSRRAEALLEQWDDRSRQFWQVLPRDRTARVTDGVARRVSAA